MEKTIRLGEALIEAGIIDNFQLKSALGQQRKWGGRLGKTLTDLGFIDETTLIKFLSEQLKFSAIDLSRSKIAAQTFKAIPKRIAEKYESIPVVIKDTPGKKTLVLAMADPTDLKAIDEIEFLTNYKIEPLVALDSAIQQILKHYGDEEASEEVLENDPAIAMDEKSSKPLKVIHGDINQVSDVQNEYFRDKSDPGPGAEVQGEHEFDLSPTPPPPEEEAAELPPPIDDTPLEMTAMEVDEASEDIHKMDLIVNEVNKHTDIIEDAEHLEQIEDARTFDDEDSSEFAEAETIEDGDDFFAGAQPVESVEEIAEHAEVVKAEDEHLEAAETVTEEHDEIPEVGEAFDTAEEAVESTESLEDIEEEIAKASEIMEDVVAEAEEVHSDEEIYEADPDEVTEEAPLPQITPDAAPEAESEVEPAPETSADIGAEQEIKSIRSEIDTLKQKMEGFMMMFVLKEQGKISLEEFIEEIKGL